MSHSSEAQARYQQQATLYAADFQEAEFALLDDVLKEGEGVKAAISVSYRSDRSLLVVTDSRLLVLNAQKETILVLQLEMTQILRTHPSMWYGAGNVSVYTINEEYYFALMSAQVYQPLSVLLNQMAAAARQSKGEDCHGSH